MKGPTAERREQCKKVIRNAVAHYEQCPLPKMANDVRLYESEKLTREQVMIGTMAFSLGMDLTSCNSGGRNVVELLDLYLRNSDARDEMNKVIVSYGREVNGWMLESA